ncbi:hypothetical protein NDU88_006865 [Pleurodeles waltl]|uniref:Uncharacterized protein n=1 Tax=Pleurodeles waltl TaxID=8319 RepID=A0AAV7N9W2_PLEWA|nr:hypothetical protein NDU88_006865 [Pleurodeles waltl]
MCSWGGCAHSCLLAVSPRGLPAPTHPQRRRPRSRRAPGPAPRERGRPGTGRYFRRLLLLTVNPGGFSPAASPGAAAPARRQDRGSHPAQGSPSPQGARAGAATALQRSRSPAPVAAPTSEREDTGSVRPASDHQKGRRLPPAPGSQSPPEVRAGAATAPQRPRPLAQAAISVSKCRTARSGASRLQFSVGPSGAEQLSVRHVQLRGHAPFKDIQ